MDDVGVDSIETAVAMSVAMEAGVIPFGTDPVALPVVLKEIGRRGTTHGPVSGVRTAAGRKMFGMTRVSVRRDRLYLRMTLDRLKA